MLLIIVVSGVVFGGACAILASNKNRDALGWFILGFLFNIVGLIVIAALTPLEKKGVEENGGDKRKQGETVPDREEIRRKSADLAASLAQSRARLDN